MATVCGFVERIKYRNEENGYTVLSLTDEGDEYTLVGNFHYISEGEMVEATGPHDRASGLWGTDDGGNL